MVQKFHAAICSAIGLPASRGPSKEYFDPRASVSVATLMRTGGCNPVRDASSTWATPFALRCIDQPMEVMLKPNSSKETEALSLSTAYPLLLTDFNWRLYAA